MANLLVALVESRGGRSVVVGVEVGHCGGVLVDGDIPAGERRG